MNSNKPLTPQINPANSLDGIRQTDKGAARRLNIFNKPRLFISFVLVVGVAAIMYFAVLASSSTNLFDQALSNALQTKNLTQYSVGGASHITIKYDVAKPSSPAVQTEGKIIQSDTQTTYSGYGTFKDSYMKFSSLTTAGKSVPKAALGKWFQVREDGSDALGGYFATLFQNDPNSAFFGDVIFGNFSQADRSKLLAYLHTHPVYKVDESKVQHITYKGQKVAVYEMTEDTTGLAGFNKLVGQVVGLRGSQLSQDLKNLHYAGSAKVYISESTKQFVHLDFGSSSNDYYAYGTTHLNNAPRPQTTFEAFENLVVTTPASM